MRVLAISGSPRRRGNTDALLERAIAGAVSAGAEVGRVVLSKLSIAPCISCNRCFRTGRCAVMDDFQELLDKTIQADGLLLASPIYFMNVSAQTKAYIDRFQCLWALRSVLKEAVPPPASGGERRAVFISTAGWAKTKFECTLQTVRAFLSTLGATLAGSLLINGVDDRGDVQGHPQLLERAFELGVRLASGSGEEPAATSSSDDS